MTNPGQTHWDGCATDGGPAHYECSLDLIARAIQPWLDIVDRFKIEWPPPAGVDHAMRAACAEITRLRALTTPQPIETAPRDTEVLVYHLNAGWMVATYSLIPAQLDGRWLWYDQNGEEMTQCVTLWLPLPEAPK